MWFFWSLLFVASPCWGFFFGGGETDVCKLCACDENTYEKVIDCTSKELTYFPLHESWIPPENKSLVVILDQNKIERIDRLPAFNITELSFSHNLITEIADQAFEKLDRLKRLDLSHNKLNAEALRAETFQGEYNEEEWEQLLVEDLDLSYNEIHSLNKDTFDHLEHVKYLNMDNNPMKEIDQSSAIALVTLRALEKLSLAQCELYDVIDGVLNTFINLTEVNFSGNKMTEVPDRLKTTHKLKKVNLNFNPIKRLDKNSFKGLEKLEELSITNMPQLRSVERNTFSCLQKLRKLKMCDNKELASIDRRAFEELEEGVLQEIDLSGNGLRTISPTLLHWESLEVVDIQNNPWNCDCQMKWVATKLLDIIERTDPALTLGINCKYPTDLSGHAFIMLADDPSVFICDKQFQATIKVQQSHSGAIAAVVVVGLLVALLGLITVLVVYMKKAKRPTPIAATSPQIRYERAPEGDGDDVKSIKFDGSGGTSLA